MYIVNSKQELKELLKKDSSIKKIKLNFKDASELYKEVLASIDPFFNKINISEWDVSKVTNMSYMFNNARSFNQPLDKWNTSNVTNMSSMFRRAKSFNQPLNNWDTSKVADMNSIFKNSGLKIPPKNIKLLKEYYKKNY